MELPTGMYLVRDAAYKHSDVMLAPFTDPQRDNSGKDVFNFFLSEVRIRIDMAFGLLQTKWGILNKPLQVNLRTSAEVIKACSRPHNFCLHEAYHPGIDPDDESILSEIRAQRESPLAWGYLPIVEELWPIPGTSLIRDIVVDRIGQLGVSRGPTHLLAYRLEIAQHSIEVKKLAVARVILLLPSLLTIMTT